MSKPTDAQHVECRITDRTWNRTISHARVALIVAGTTLAVCVAVNLPLLRTWQAHGDIWALILHSTRFHPVSAGEWIRIGFQDYFVNYPEATQPYTGFVRPMVNATVWLESLFASGPNSRLFFLTNYLGHAACCAMVYLVAVCLGGLTRGRAVLAAALFAGTRSGLELLQDPAFRADMLGAAFGVSALLAAYRWLDGRGGLGWIAASVLLLVLAPLSKETAFPAALIVSAALLWLPARRSPRARVAAAVAVLLTLTLFGLTRAVGPHAVYVSLTRAGQRREAIEMLASAFFPGAVWDMLTVVHGRLAWSWEVAQLFGAAVMNAVAAALTIHAIAVRRDATAARLAAMGAAALAVPLLLAPASRMMYFGQMFALPLFVRVLPERRVAAAALAALALVVAPASTLTRMADMQPGNVTANRESHAVQTAIHAQFRLPAVRRLYLLNDVTGEYAALAMLRALALDAHRPDVALYVVNSMRSLGGEGPAGHMTILLGSGQAQVLEECTVRCYFYFPGVRQQDKGKMGNSELIYQRAEPRALQVAIGTTGNDFALVGFDPADAEVHVLGPGDTAWHPFASGAAR